MYERNTEERSEQGEQRKKSNKDSRTTMRDAMLVNLFLRRDGESLNFVSISTRWIRYLRILGGPRKSHSDSDGQSDPPTEVRLSGSELRIGIERIDLE